MANRLPIGFMEELQREIVELAGAKRLQDAVNKAFETAKKTGERDEVSNFLITIGMEVGNKGDYYSALLLFEAAEKTAEKEEIKNLARENQAIAHRNYAILLKELKRRREAKKHYKKAMERSL